MGQASKTSLPPEFQKLEGIGKNLVHEAAPFRQQLLAQGAEALTTGGVGAKIPLIQQMVSASGQALSQGLSQTAEGLTKRNIGGPFAASMLAGQRQAGLQQIAGIPTSVAERVIAQTTPFAMGATQAGMGGIAQAGQASFASDAFNALQFKAAMQDIKSSLQSVGGGMASAG